MEHHQLSAEAATQLQDGINLLLSRWSALQIAVENGFGGRDSSQKSQQLPIDLFSLLTQSKDAKNNLHSILALDAIPGIALFIVTSLIAFVALNLL